MSRGLERPGFPGGEQGEISSATLKKWRDQKLIGYSAVGNTYYYTDEDIESFFRNNHKKSVFEAGMDD